MDQLVGTADQLQVVDMDKLWKENKDYKVNGHFFGPSLPKMKGANSQSYRKSERKCLSLISDNRHISCVCTATTLFTKSTHNYYEHFQ